MPQPNFVRVRDKRTDHEYSTRYPNKEHHEVLKAEAVDGNGDPLPHKFAEKKAAAKKENPS